MLKISAFNASAAAKANADFPTPVGPQTTSTDVVFASLIGAGHYTVPADFATCLVRRLLNLAPRIPHAFLDEGAHRLGHTLDRQHIEAALGRDNPKVRAALPNRCHDTHTEFRSEARRRERERVRLGNEMHGGFAHLAETPDRCSVVHCVNQYGKNQPERHRNPHDGEYPSLDVKRQEKISRARRDHQQKQAPIPDVKASHAVATNTSLHEALSVGQLSFMHSAA